jgi:hypothetical protein
MEQHHTNPLISVLSGTIFGIIAFITEHGFLINNALQLIKVILFGFIGGIFGYLGREFIRLIIKKYTK